MLDEYQLIYISAGNGWFQSAESRRTKITAGRVIVLFPGVWHSYAPSSETGWDEHWVGFNGDIARRFIQHGFFAPTRPVFQALEEDTLSDTFHNLIERAHRNHPASQQLMAAATIQILALLYSAQQSKRVAADEPNLQVIQKAMSRLREAVTAAEPNIDLEKIATELRVSYRWFRRAFALHTGLSPHQYVSEMRLARVRHLLARTSMTIKEVSASVGFEDTQYFRKFFHKKLGVTPGVWRARAQRTGPTDPQKGSDAEEEIDLK